MTRNGRGKCDYIVTNALHLDLTTVVLWKKSRWDIETMFRDGKQLAGLAACQCRVPQAVVRHVAFVLVTCTILNLMGIDWSETANDVKEQLQLQVVAQGCPPPPPLRARTL